MWEKYDYETYACQEAFDADPARVWDFHDERRRVVGVAEPNAGHGIIAAVQKARPNTVVITQNVDGLHQRAGANGVIELHGSLWRVRCAGCRTVTGNREVPLQSRTCRCGTWLRPDVTWFGDPLDMDAIEASQRAIGACDVLISIGTSGSVFPAAYLPQIAVRTGAERIEINPEETQVSGWYNHHLRGPASAMLEEVCQALLF